MNTNPHKLMLSALALAIAGIAASGAAHGSAFELRENSVKAQGRAMAGSASAIGDASVVANNPAMMSSFDEKTFQLDVTTIDLSFEFEGGGSAAAGFEVVSVDNGQPAAEVRQRLTGTPYSSGSHSARGSSITRGSLRNCRK